MLLLLPASFAQGFRVWPPWLLKLLQPPEAALTLLTLTSALCYCYRLGFLLPLLHPFIWLLYIVVKNNFDTGGWWSGVEPLGVTQLFHRYDQNIISITI